VLPALHDGIAMNWTFEPGHTAAEFCVRHMMVTYVRGHFKNVQGKLRFDPSRPAQSSVSVRIDARTLWTGDAARDAHLRSPDFLDVERFPQISFEGDQVEVLGDHDYVVTGDLTIRGITRKVPIKTTYLGQWQTPWWENGVDKGPKTRAGFVATAEINRHDFGVSWNTALHRNGIAVGKIVKITLDAEAILDDVVPRP
jgi:polyisoprenoid-binding protein YceI